MIGYYGENWGLYSYHGWCPKNILTVIKRVILTSYKRCKIFIFIILNTWGSIKRNSSCSHNFYLKILELFRKSQLSLQEETRRIFRINPKLYLNGRNVFFMRNFTKWHQFPGNILPDNLVLLFCGISHLNRVLCSTYKLLFLMLLYIINLFLIWSI